MNIENIPQALRQYPQWVLWREEQRTDKHGKPVLDKHGKPKMTKVPYTVQGAKASSTNHNDWATFEAVKQAYENESGGFDGIGFVFSENDPFTGIDIDDCFSILTGFTELADSIIKQLNSYTEYSHSGEGIHIIVEATLPGENRKDSKKGLEMYDKKRFFALTGKLVSDTKPTVEKRQQEVNELYQEHFHKDETPVETPADVQKSPPMTDDDIMDKALKAKNGEKFKKLYSGDISGYPSESESDQALCNILAFYTQDPEQIDRMFRNSGLKRDKWDRDDYRISTINKAIKDTKEHYKGKRTPTAKDDFLNGIFSPIIPQNGEIDPSNMKATPGQFNLTELGNAERVIHFHRDKIKYSKGKGFLLWDGVRWAVDEGNRIEVIIANTLRGLYFEAQETDDEGLQEATFKWAKRCEARNIRTNCEQDIKPRLFVHNDELDANPFLLNVKNGVIDLKNGELLKHNPSHMITRLVPVEYDKNATAPRWEQFLQEIFVTEEGQTDHDVIRFMQKAIGYSLSGDTSEEVIFFLTGTGGNGKSKFVEAIQGVLGDYASQTNADTFIKKKHDNAINNDIARLDGVRFVSAMESEQGEQLAESLVKQLTGGDKIAARFLRKEFFEFRPAFKIFFSTNHKPIIKGTDEGIWRRIRIIPFNARFSGKNRDTNLSKKLEKEKAGILSWAVEGFKLWQKEGLIPPQSIDQATKEYRDDMDIIKPFIDEYCIVDESSQELAKILYSAYSWFGSKSGDITVKHNKAFYRLLESQGYRLVVGYGNKRYVKGLKLKDGVMKIITDPTQH